MKWLTLSLFALLPAALLGCSGSEAPSDGTPSPGAAPAEETADPLKAAFLYVGPVGDAGWTYAHDLGRKDLEAHFGEKIETAYLESVPEGAEAERALTQFAEKGYGLIFGTSFGYMDPIQQVAARYPDVTFMHCSGYKRAANVGTYFGRMYEAKYLSGLLAGEVSESGVLGYVAPHPIPEVIRHINAFAIGAREVNPEAKIKVVWTNSWFDPAKEKEAADALLDAGADLIATGADSAAPLQAAAARGALAIGYDSDSSALAPEAFLTAPVWDWSVIYREVAQTVMDGSRESWQDVDYWDGMSAGVVQLLPRTELVPPEVESKIAARQAEFVANTEGKELVFLQDLKRQDGSPAWPEGAPTDELLLGMKFFVQGVEGEIPE